MGLVILSKIGKISPETIYTEDAGLVDMNGRNIVKMMIDMKRNKQELVS